MCHEQHAEGSMTNKKFDRFVFTLMGGAIIATATASIVSPHSSVVASPRVTYDAASAERADLDQQQPATELASAELAAGNAAVSLKKVRGLAKHFEEIGYHLDRVRDQGALVPRVFLAELPDDLNNVPEVSLKKTVFFQTMLPLILNENERILADRHRLIGLKAARAMGKKLSPTDRLWLIVLSERYKVKNEDLETLLSRVDVIPTSLAMAQAAEESGWGTSRFAQVGNALFGQWTTSSGNGIVPEDREQGADHKVRAFDSLAQSVSAYMRNLNTHGAYRSFRAQRAQMRDGANVLDGTKLAGSLTKYSERGKEYVDSVRTIISVNELEELDGAKLAENNDDDQSV